MPRFSRKRSNQEPLTYLTQTIWRYSVGKRRLLLLYVTLCTIALLTTLLEPIVLGRLVNAITASAQHGSLLPEVWQWLGVFACFPVAFWIFHGPSRVMENWMSIYVRQQFQLLPRRLNISR